MSISDTQFKAWLKQDGVNRTVLCRMTYVIEDAGEPLDQVFRCSDRGYIDLINDEAYPDYIDSVPQYTRALSGERLGLFTSSVGAMELNNEDGKLDYLLPLAVDGSNIEFYFGDQSWPFDDFRKIFTALVDKIAIPNWGRITVQLKDTGLLLNKSIGGTVKLGGDGPNADQWRALNFGFVRQAPCTLYSEIDLIYSYNESGTGVQVSVPGHTQLIYDRGLPVGYVDGGNGTVTLDATPDGEITASLLVTPDGNAAHRCVSDAMLYFIGDKCGLTALGKYYGAGITYEVRPTSGIAAWIAAGGEDYLIGINISDKRNVSSDLLPAIVDSGLCFWAINRDGLFTYGRLRPHDISSLGVASQATIQEDDIINQISISHADPTYYRYQGICNKNWKIVSDYALVLSPEELATLQRKGLFVIQSEFAGTYYADNPQLYNKTLEVSPEIETLLSGGDDVTDTENFNLWLDLRRNMFLPWLEISSVSVDLSYYFLELGDPVTLKIPRFQYDSGILTQVISTNIRLTDARVDLKLLRRRVPEAPPEGWTPTPIPGEGSSSTGLYAPPVNTIGFLDCIFPRGPQVFRLLDINCPAESGSIGEAIITTDVQGYTAIGKVESTTVVLGVPEADWEFDEIAAPPDQIPGRFDSMQNWSQHIMYIGSADPGTTDPADFSWVVTQTVGSAPTGGPPYVVARDAMDATLGWDIITTPGNTDPLSLTNLDWAGTEFSLQCQVFAVDFGAPVTIKASPYFTIGSITNTNVLASSHAGYIAPSEGGNFIGFAATWTATINFNNSIQQFDDDPSAGITTLCLGARGAIITAVGFSGSGVIWDYSVDWNPGVGATPPNLQDITITTTGTTFEFLVDPEAEYETPPGTTDRIPYILFIRARDASGDTVNVYPVADTTLAWPNDETIDTETPTTTCFRFNFY